MFFVTPILWPEDRAQGYLRLVVDLNPLAYLVGAYRDLVLEGEVPGGMATLWFGLFAGVLCVTGFVLFLRVKQRFADLI
jgi:ABC-type polysaccharide/polyol phosphate export permease